MDLIPIAESRSAVEVFGYSSQIMIAAGYERRLSGVREIPALPETPGGLIS